MEVILQAYTNFEGDIFNLRKPTGLEVKKQYHIKFSNRFAVLENWSYSEEIDRGWKNFKEVTETSATASLDLLELQQHKPSFDEEIYVIYIKGNRLKCNSYRIQTKEI